MIRSWLVPAAFLCVACGGPEPAREAVDLPIEVLAGAPTGEPVPFYGDVRAGRWRTVIRKSWTRTTRRGEETGRARLELVVDTTREGARFVTRVALGVPEVEGLGEPFVREFDGLRVVSTHDESGRPDPATLAFETPASPRARGFLRGLWAAGLAGTTPWVPRGPVREGGTWTRRAMGGLEAMVVPPGASTNIQGGARLEAVREEDGERVADVRLETLIEAGKGTRGIGPDEIVDLGIRDRGRATVRVRDGLPLRWTLEETVVLHRARGAETEKEILTLEVEGTTSLLPPRDR